MHVVLLCMCLHKICKMHCYKYPYAILLYLCACCAQCQKIDENDVKNSWIPKFKTSLETFIVEVLQPRTIDQAIQNEIKSDTLYRINDEEEFYHMYGNISNRLNKTHQALKEFKNSIENEISKNHVTTKKSLNTSFCCMPPSSPPTYEGRVRQDVYTTQPCTGTTFTAGLLDSFNALKKNYKDDNSILWQYFTTTDGQFIQYPTSRRYCAGHKIISPLTEEWFVDKLYMREKNVVIVFNTGNSTSKKLGKFTILESIQEAVSLALNTFTSNDRVNIVFFNDTAYVPDNCDNRLFIANKKNVDKIKEFKKTATAKGSSDYSKGLEKAYDLLLSEKQKLSKKFSEVDNFVIFVTDSLSAEQQDVNQLYKMIADEQKILGGRVSHMVYGIGPKTNLSSSVLYNIAEQKDIDWPKGFNITGLTGEVGGDGLIQYLTNESTIPTEVGTYYERLPTDITKTVTVIAPLQDKDSGLMMTASIPVYKNSSSVYGIAAFDISMTTIFSEVVNFYIGVHSYSFMFETRHGHVILHPKLKDPDENKDSDVVFPHIQTIEPDLSPLQIEALLSCNTRQQNFIAMIHPGRSSYMSDTLISSQHKLNATVRFAQVPDTRFCVVMVMFNYDRYLYIPDKTNQGTKFHAPYHRIDRIHNAPETNKPSNGVCSMNRKFVALQESTIKLSPIVFKSPEKYKFEKESFMDIRSVNQFLENSKPTQLILEEVQEEIQRTLKATDNLDSLWRPTYKQVIERFLATSTGVFRSFPGTPLPNVYNHIQHLWYKRSIANPGTLIVTTGKLNQYSQKDVMLLTKALSINQNNAGGHQFVRQLQGVVGATVSQRHLTGLLINNIIGCQNEDIECHLVDEDGYLILKKDQHITHKFPWIANNLIKKQMMKPEWCTLMSDGKHNLSYTIDLTFDFSQSKGDNCKEFVIGKVDGTNLYLLVLNNRTKNSCNEKQNPTESCTCKRAPRAPPGLPVICTHCFQDLGTTCQCPCQCNVDFDQCSSEFRDANRTDFPHTACYYDPLTYTPEHTKVKPDDVKTPVIPKCDVPCVYMETKSNCSKLPHCKWTEDKDFYPMCVWKNDTVTTTEIPSSTKTTIRGPPKTPPPRPPSKSTLSIKTPPPKVTGKTPGSNRPPNRTPPGVKPSTATMILTSTTGPHIKSSLPTQLSTVTVNKIPSTSLVTMATKSTATPSTGVSLTSPPLSKSTIGNGSTNKQKQGNGGDSTDPGLIAGIVIVCLLLLAVLAFIGFKVYRKNFKRPGVGDRAARYAASPGSSFFDGALFKRDTEQAVLTTSAPSSTVPYNQMR